jgi:hypothetical protein
MAAAKPRVALIGTGGTISSIGAGPLDLGEYMDTSRKAEPGRGPAPVRRVLSARPAGGDTRTVPRCEAARRAEADVDFALAARYSNDP